MGNTVIISISQAVKTIKTAILKSQYHASKQVNAEQLSLYYGIGKYISENSREGFWGTGAILFRPLPAVETADSGNRSPAAVEISLLTPDKQSQTVNLTQLSEFLSIGFTHHIGYTMFEQFENLKNFEAAFTCVQSTYHFHFVKR